MKTLALFVTLIFVLPYTVYSYKKDYYQILHKYYECTNLKNYYRLKPMTVSQHKRIFSKHPHLTCREMRYTKEYVDLLKPN